MINKFKFSDFRLSFWIRHFGFWKSGTKFVFCDLHNTPSNENYSSQFIFQFLSSAILNPPFWILKIWWWIRNQRSQKHPKWMFPLWWKSVIIRILPFGRHIVSAILCSKNLHTAFVSPYFFTNFKPLLDYFYGNQFWIGGFIGWRRMTHICYNNVRIINIMFVRCEYTHIIRVYWYMAVIAFFFSYNVILGHDVICISNT